MLSRRAMFSELLVTVGSFPTRPPRSHRNLRKGPSGLADEISFEDFLTIMAYFRPIDIAMDEEQVQLCRKEKLRCACPSLFCSGWGGGVGWVWPAGGEVRGCQPLGGRSQPPYLRGVPGVSLSSGVAPWRPPREHPSAAGGSWEQKGLWVIRKEQGPWFKQTRVPMRPFHWAAV